LALRGRQNLGSQDTTLIELLRNDPFGLDDDLTLYPTIAISLSLSLFLSVLSTLFCAKFFRHALVLFCLNLYEHL